jgi:RNA polymerase sigma-70 factor (ECF subfamily)
MLRDEPDEVLMVAYQKGDARAFEIILTRHRRAVFNFILRYVGSRETAEDLLQETFLRVIKGAATYEKQAKLTTWIFTIARNLCTDQSRRAKHRRAQSLDAPLSRHEEKSGTLHEILPNKQQLAADRQTISNQLHDRLHAAIAKLGDEQREVFLMREFCELQFKEIAEIVGVPENTVKSRMRYALEKLRVELEEYADMAKALQG